MFVVYILFCVFFFKQKTAYEMRISDWSSDVCSSDLAGFSLVQSRIQADPYAGVDLREKCVQFFLRLCADLSFHIVGLEPAFIGDVESMHEREDRKSTRLNSRH